MSTAVEQTAHYCNKYAVICTGANGHGECITTACWNSQWWHDDVIAWMPLPTPYGGESDE